MNGIATGVEFVFALVLMLGVVVTVHELGHFWAAKACGVRVLKFSIGFGNPIGFGRFRLRWLRSGTEYVIAWFPLGGFVKMLGEATDDEAHASRSVAPPPDSLAAQPLWKKLMIILARARDEPAAARRGRGREPVRRASSGATPTVGTVEPGSPAAEVGIRPGDRVLALDGEPIAVLGRPRARGARAARARRSRSRSRAARSASSARSQCASSAASICSGRRATSAGSASSTSGRARCSGWPPPTRAPRGRSPLGRSRGGGGRRAGRGLERVRSGLRGGPARRGGAARRARRGRIPGGAGRARARARRRDDARRDPGRGARRRGEPRACRRPRRASSRAICSSPSTASRSGASARSARRARERGPAARRQRRARRGDARRSRSRRGSARPRPRTRGAVPDRDPGGERDRVRGPLALDRVRNPLVALPRAVGATVETTGIFLRRARQARVGRDPAPLDRRADRDRAPVAARAPARLGELRLAARDHQHQPRRPEPAADPDPRRRPGARSSRSRAAKRGPLPRARASGCSRSGCCCSSG